MSRLPVSDDARKTEDEGPVTVRVSGLSLAVGLMLFGLWLLGVREIGAGIDVECWDRYLTRRGELVEGITCAATAGPRGWLLLGWGATFPAITGWWLRRKLRVAKR